jgi:hypothetical protein
VVILALAGCDTDEDSPSDDGAEDGGGGGMADGAAGGEGDAAISRDASSSCSWSRLAPVASVNTSAYERPGSLDSDGRTLLFERFSGSPTDSFHLASRASIEDEFGEPTQIEELSDEFHHDPEISASGLEFFYRLQDSFLIEYATRRSPTDTFTQAGSIGFGGASPALSADGLSLYIVADVTPIMRATRKAPGEPWETPTAVFEEGQYASVDVSTDELRLLLTANPFADPPNPILIAERSSTDEAFGEPRPVDDGLLLPDANTYVYAKWGANATQMVVSVDLGDGNDGDIYYSICQ